MFGNPLEMTPMTARRQDTDLRAYSRWEYGTADYARTLRSAARAPRAPLWPRVWRRMRTWMASLRGPATVDARGIEE